MAYPLPSLLSHPLAVVLYVLRQPFGISVVVTCLNARMDGLKVLERRRNFDHGFADHYRNWIQV